MAEAAEYGSAPAKKAEGEPEPKGAGDNAQSASAKAWIDEIRTALRGREAWVRQNKDIIRRFRQMEKVSTPANAPRGRRLSLFWSNIETLKPATFAYAPKPVVRRRYHDEDPLARMTSEVLERAIRFNLEARDTADIFCGARDEYLLVGQGQVWVRYQPKLRKELPGGDEMVGGEQVSQGGEAYDVVDWEEAVLDHVTWDDFLTNVARKWTEVRWTARRVFMTRKELVARFPDCGKHVPLNHKAPEEPDRPEDHNSPHRKAEVWEVWDKPSRKACWINLDYPEKPLDERDDPLGLTEFFPCPRPLLATTGPDSLLPTPDIIYYRSQLKDIDELTARIGRLTDALKMRGFYAAGSQVGKDLQNLFERDTNELIPVDSWAAYSDAGGVKGLIEWLPLDMVITTITSCIQARKQLIDDVYQITGISDILRGDNDPRETATATRTKQVWGSSRVRCKQRDIARFCRDAVELVGEVIAARFSSETLAAMTNLKMLKDPQQRQQLQQSLAMQAQQQAMQQQAMAAQQQAPMQPGQPPPPAPMTRPFQPPPEVMELLGRPTWSEVTELLRDNVTRSFRIDIETDSTIEPDATETVERRVQVTQVLGLYISKTIPLIQLYPQAASLVTATAKWLIQSMHDGREIEEDFGRALDTLQQGIAQAPPGGGQDGKNQTPAGIVEAQKMQAQAAGVGAQAKLMSAQAEQLKAQTGAAKARADVETDRAEIQADNLRTLAQHQEDRDYQRNELATQEREALLRYQAREFAKDATSPPKPKGEG
jgi:hypothetical protein